jgi:hypothetical protein
MKRLFACFLYAFAVQATAGAHVLDEYIQGAQIELAPGGPRIELRLTPGARVADRVFAMIDVDGDGQISPAEQRGYARRVLQDLALEVDGRRAPLALIGIDFPSRSEMNQGIGAIRLDLAADAPLSAAGEHQLVFRNEHLPELGAYLVNALIPTSREIKIGGQERDPYQREMRLSFHVNPTPAGGPRPWAVVLMLCVCLVLLFPQWKYLRRYSDRRNNETIHTKKTLS